MEIRTEVREIEKHIKQMAPLSPKAQIAIISKAQGLTKDEHSITVLALVKNRIIRSQLAAPAAKSDYTEADYETYCVDRDAKL